MSKSVLVPAWQKVLYRFGMFALFITGMAQMPIFKRYYIADIPGLEWTANYAVTHIAHYGLAIAILFFCFYLAGRFISEWRKRYSLTTPGRIKTVLLAGILITGLARVLKNQPDFFFSPTTTMLIDWTHLGLVMVLGIVAAVTAGKGYLR
ncbi:MAG TPA: FeS-binding protein [Desulfomicrobiaceae bacterium]|nr:FeS-binding protein [Desulfomicrobiaceae bacterium]